MPQKRKRAPPATAMRLVLEAVQTMLDHESGMPFGAPVTEEVLGGAWAQYTRVVTQPMDLGTVCARLRQNSNKKKLKKKTLPKPYDSADEAVRDILLTFDNARRFNPPKHWVHEDANALEALFRSKYGAALAQKGIPLPTSKAASPLLIPLPGAGAGPGAVSGAGAGPAPGPSSAGGAGSDAGLAAETACFVCHQAVDYANVLLCDNDCGREYHLYCLVPKLTEPPEGRWECPECVKQQVKGQEQGQVQEAGKAMEEAQGLEEAPGAKEAQEETRAQNRAVEPVPAPLGRFLTSQWSAEEDKLVMDLHQKLGNSWVEMEKIMHGRSADSLRKRCKKLYDDLGRVQPTQPVLRPTQELRAQLSQLQWSEEEDKLVMDLHHKLGNSWVEMEKIMHGRSADSIRKRCKKLYDELERVQPLVTTATRADGEAAIFSSVPTSGQSLSQVQSQAQVHAQARARARARAEAETQAEMQAQAQARITGGGYEELHGREERIQAQLQRMVAEYEQQHHDQRHQSRDAPSQPVSQQILHPALPGQGAVSLVPKFETHQHSNARNRQLMSHVVSAESLHAILSRD